MPDITGNVWVDSTFISDSAEEPINVGSNINTQLELVNNDNIGEYSIPSIYINNNLINSNIDTVIESYIETNTTSGINDISSYYKVFGKLETPGIIISLVEFIRDDTLSSGTINSVVSYDAKDYDILTYMDKYVNFIGGHKWYEFNSVPIHMWYKVTKSGTLDWITNYTNFSGNLETDDTPILFYNYEYDIVTEYGSLYESDITGLDTEVDISFAGWVDYELYTDIFSSLMGTSTGYRTESEIIPGNVNIHYMDMISSDLSIIDISCGIYSSLESNSYLTGDVTTISGRIGNVNTDIYSTIETHSQFKLNVDLLSLSIRNFFPGVEKFATSSESIHVDIVDDECQIDTSNTYLMINGYIVETTIEEIKDGYRMFYNPEDNFESLEGPTTFTVHAENKCGKHLEQDFYLTFGYIVEYTNYPELSNIDFGFNNKVAVRVTAENFANCPQTNSLAWDFTSKLQSNTDLGASIVGRISAFENSDINATIYPKSTAYFYGKEFRIVVKAKDFSGNEMEPLILAYRIENKPT